MPRKPTVKSLLDQKETVAPRRTPVFHRTPIVNFKASGGPARLAAFARRHGVVLPTALAEAMFNECMDHVCDQLIGGSHFTVYGRFTFKHVVKRLPSRDKGATPGRLCRTMKISPSSTMRERLNELPAESFAKIEIKKLSRPPSFAPPGYDYGDKYYDNANKVVDERLPEA